jgi:hypothetical protein
MNPPIFTTDFVERQGSEKIAALLNECYYASIETDKRLIELDSLGKPAQLVRNLRIPRELKQRVAVARITKTRTRIRSKDSVEKAA